MNSSNLDRQEVVTCSGCENQLSRSAKFCEECGRAVSVEETTQAEKVAAVASATPEESHKIGTKLDWLLVAIYGFLVFSGSVLTGLVWLVAAAMMAPPIKIKLNDKFPLGYGTIFNILVFLVALSSHQILNEVIREKEARQIEQAREVALAKRTETFLGQKDEILQSLKGNIKAGDFDQAINDGKKYADLDAEVTKLLELAKNEKSAYEKQLRLELAKKKAPELLANGHFKAAWDLTQEFADSPELKTIADEAHSKHLAAKEEDRAKPYIKRVERELKGLSNFSVDTYTQSKESIILGTVLFGAWAKIIEESKEYQLSSKQKVLIDKFRSRVSRIQVSSFPKLRDAYGPAVRKSLWEHDMSARTYGSGFKTLELVGAAFAANRNVKKFQESISELMHMLRFKQVRYKWYKGADKYNYYNMSSLPDRDIVVWLEGGRYRQIK
jgi:hypothetical protein